MALSNIKVGSIVPWSNGHRASSKFHINGCVFDNRCGNGAVYPFHLKLLPMLILLVAVVVWMQYHVFVSEFCFRTAGSNNKRAVFKIVEFSLFFNPFNLIV